VSDSDGSRDFDWFGPPRSNTLRPVSSFHVLVEGLSVVRATNWSGEGVDPKSLEYECSVRPTPVTVALLSLL
jgi:hypothetical protein